MFPIFCSFSLSVIPFNLNGSQPQLRPHEMIYYFPWKYDACYIYWDKITIFDFETKLTYKQEMEPARVVYSPNTLIPKPSDAEYSTYSQPQGNPKANLWICSKTQKKCLPIGYTDAEKTKIQMIGIPSNTPHTQVEIQLAGIGSYTSIIQAEVSDHAEYPDIIILDENKFRFHIYTPGFSFKYDLIPEMPQIDPKMQKKNYSMEETIAYEISSAQTYINFSFMDFPAITTDKGVKGQFTTNYPAIIYLDLAKHIPCPSDYDCTKFDRTEANIWKCWTSLYNEKVCYPLADIDYGFEFATNRLYINSSISPKSAVRFQFKCDTRTQFNPVFLQKEAKTDIHIFEFSTSFVCQKPIPETVVVKQYTIGALFILSVWIFIVLFVCIGIVINYIINSDINLPLPSIWSAIGFYIVDGWDKITCSSRTRLVEEVSHTPATYATI